MTDKENYLQNLFINEAKPALKRHSGGTGGGSTVDKVAVVKQIVDLKKSAKELFYYGQERLTDELLAELISYDTFENATNIENCFGYCTHLTVVPLTNTSNVKLANSAFQQNLKLVEPPCFNTEKWTDANYIFSACVELKVIPAFDFRSMNSCSFWINGDSKIEEIWIKNIKTNLQVGSGTSYGHLIKQECLIHLIKELRDTGAMKTLTIGSANREKLVDVYVKPITITDEMRAEDDLIDEKLPFVLCESTDEEATPIEEYVQFKNWQIA